METLARVLVAGASEVEERRVAALLESAGLAPQAIEHAGARPASGLIGDPRAWDLVALAGPPDALVSTLEACSERSPAVPALLFADEFTQGVAQLSHSFGAPVCLFAHGAGAVRHALSCVARPRAPEGPKSAKLAATQRPRRELEDAVAASERVRALVYLAVGDVIFSLGVEGDAFRFLEINPAFTKATGLTEAQVIGKLVSEVIPEPSLSLVLAKYRQAIAERLTVRWQETTEYPTGTKYGEVSVTPLLDEAGRCTTLIGTVHDVTDVRQAEETVRLYADIASAVQIGLTLWSVPDPSDPASITLITANPAADQATGIELSRHLGEPLLALMPPAGASEIADLVCQVARDRKPRELPAYDFVESPGRRRSFTLAAFPLSGRRVGLAIEDVSEQARARALRAAEHRALEMVASDASLSETLAAFALAVEDLAPPSRASVLLLTPDGANVLQVVAPHLPDEFARALQGGPSTPWLRASGASRIHRRSVVVADIADDPAWEEHRALALRLGLRACWSTPIFASYGRLLGVFALYGGEARAPGPGELDLFGRATHVAGIAIQRHELDEQLRELAARLEAAREEERTGIAREIHDQLGQALTAIKLDLSWIARRAASPAGLDAQREPLLERVRGALALTDEVIQQVRRISAELRPAVLDDLGLTAALEWQAHEFQKRTGVSCVVSSSLGEEQLSRDVSTAVFRIFQEALTNIARHASATQVDVSLQRDAASLRLEVRDDGTGVSAEIVQSPQSLGLLGMRERARYVGGVAEVRAAEKGTLVSLEVPLASGRAPEEPA